MNQIYMPIGLRRGFSLLLFIGLSSFLSFSQKKAQVLCVAPIVSVSSNATICNGQSSSLSASAVSGTPPYTFTWSPSGSLVNPNSSNPVASPSTTTTYTVIVDDQGGQCKDTGFVTVTVPTVSVSISGVNTICSGQSTTLTATGANSYAWSPTGSLNFSNISNPVATPSVSVNYSVIGTGANSCTATATYSVTVNTTPTVTITGTNTICNGASTSLSASGASTYVWSPGGSLDNANISNPVATPSVSTNYTVTGTSANSCTSNSVISVVVNPTPTVSITGTTTMCSGQNATLNGNGASTYTWLPGSLSGGSIVVVLTTNTTYTVTGTDANSCTATAISTVTVNPLPTANAGADVSVCAGDNTTFNGTGNGTFLWSPSVGLSCTTCSNPICTPTGATTYTLSVTNICGTAVDSVSVTYPALPSANAGPDVTICSGASATLTGTGSGTFIWSPSGTLSCVSCANPVATPTTTSTTYSFSITASCGTNTDEVTVTIETPVAGITGNTTVCSGQTTTLTGTGGVTYVWNTGASAISITDNPTTSTGYTVVSTDGYGCTATASITVNPSPLPVANAGTDVSICAGSSTTLSATGTGTFLWSPATDLSCTTCANPTANPTASTTYTVTVTNNCGSVSDSVLVSITTTPSVNAGIDATICEGASVSLNASGSGTYTWTPTTGLSNPFIANPVATPTVTTDYTVTISDVCGTASDVVTVNVNSLPTANIIGTDTICSGTSTTLSASGGGTYSWNPGGSTSASITVSPTTTTGYSVTVTSAAGCSSPANFTVNVSTVTAAISGNGICEGQNATLTASGGNTYVWNTGSSATSIVVSPTTSTDYTVTAMSSFGCTQSATYSVVVSAQPTATITTGSTTVCSGTVTSLDASGGATYSWKHGCNHFIARNFSNFFCRIHCGCC